MPGRVVARQEQRKNEEDCCDISVVRSFPKRKKSYARAVLETAAFLSNACPHVPSLANAFDPSRSLTGMLADGVARLQRLPFHKCSVRSRCPACERTHLLDEVESVVGLNLTSLIKWQYDPGSD
jgi:hypothetical protein